MVATVNSDDPAYFGGYVNDNFTQLFAAVPALTAQHAYQLACNSFEGSFLPHSEKQAFIERLQKHFRDFA